MPPSGCSAISAAERATLARFWCHHNNRNMRSTPRRILLVDDEEDNLDALQELLTLEGQAAETALGGQAAVDRFLKGERFDLVLCDIGMPGMSGWQVVEEIRRIAPETEVW